MGTCIGSHNEPPRDEIVRKTGSETPGRMLRPSSSCWKPCWFLRRSRPAAPWRVVSPPTTTSSATFGDGRRYTSSCQRYTIKEVHTVCTKRGAVIVRGSIPSAGGNDGVIQVGQYAESDRVFSADDVDAFGKLVGDDNPLHKEWNLEEGLPKPLENHPMIRPTDDGGDGKTTKILVHGMLVSSLFTSILGTLIPGAVYLKQSLEFVRPVYVGERVTGKITIERIIRRRSNNKGLILICDTTVRSSSQNADHPEEDQRVRGKARVWLPNRTAETAAAAATGE